MTTPNPIPAAALDQPLCVVGTVGSGKTYAAKSAVEFLLAEGRRVVIVDPTGVWWGLRTRSDGTPGHPVMIFGGEHADVPVSPDAGDALGRLVAEDRVAQAIIDVSEMSGGERTRFLTAFLERLYAGRRVPRHLVLDEADEMAPQDPLPETRRLQGIVDRIVRRGRVRGFRPLMITQRPAVLHKNVLSQIATLVALRLTSPQDRKAVEGWVRGSADLDVAKTVLASLPGLEVGEGWVWAPREGVLERVRFPKIDTLDTSATPDLDAAPDITGTMAPVDVAAIRAALASDSVVEPEDRAAQGVQARRRSAGDAGAPASPVASPAASPEEIAAAERRGYARGLREGEYRGEMRALERARTALSNLRPEGTPPPVLRTLSPEELAARKAALADAQAREKAARRPTPSRTTPPPPADGAAVMPTRQRILNAIAWFMSLSPEAPEREIVAFLAGASSRSSGFANNLGALRTAGLIDYPGPGLVILTETGCATAVAPTHPLDHQAIAAAVRERLPAAQWRLLDQLIDIYPREQPRDALARAVGASSTSSGFANNLGRLRTLGLLTYPAGGFVRAADMLFPETEKGATNVRQLHTHARKL